MFLCLNANSVNVPFPLFTLVPVFGKSSLSAPTSISPLAAVHLSFWFLPNKAGFSGLTAPQCGVSLPLGPSFILPVSEEAPLTFHCYHYYYAHYCDHRSHPGPTQHPSPASQSPIVHGFHSSPSALATSSGASHTTHQSTSPSGNLKALSHPPSPVPHLLSRWPCSFPVTQSSCTIHTLLLSLFPAHICGFLDLNSLLNVKKI